VSGKRVISLLRISDEDEGSGLVAHWLLQCVQQNGFYFTIHLQQHEKEKVKCVHTRPVALDATRFTFNMS
jgi:hypothetical protein